jgi:DNA polymerase III alpha subunit
LGTIDEFKIIEKTEELKWTSRILHCLKRSDAMSCSVSIEENFGVLYIESPAMRGLLRRLKCDNYKTLVPHQHHSSWVAQSGMMREYILDNNPDKFEYFHEVSKSSWANLCVMVYQEDVIKVRCIMVG